MGLIYTKGSTNIVADALSRLNTEPTSESTADAKNFVNVREANAVLCGMEKRLAKHGMEKHQVFVPNLASSNFPLMF